MDVFDSRYYKLNTIFLSSFGRWTYQTGSTKRFAQVFILISLFASIIPQAFYVYSVRYDIDAVLEWTLPFFIIFGSFIVLCILIIYEKQIRKILDCIKNDWTVWTSGMELEILKAYAEKGRLFTLVYTVNFNVGIIAIVIQSLTSPILDYFIPLSESRPRLLCFGIKIPFDQDEYFYWLITYGVFTGFYNCLILIGSQSLYAISVMHACGLFQIIRFRLKRLSEAIENEENSKRENLQDFIYEELSSIINIHTYALQLRSDINYCFSPALSVIIAINCLVLSATGIQLLNAIQNMNNVLKFVGYTVSIFFNFYIVMLPPEKLLESSEEVGVEAYALFWYKIPNKSKKLLLLLIHQSQKPCRLTAGKIYTIDMETFSALLQTSISFFTVLFSMQ